MSPLGMAVLFYRAAKTCMLLVLGGQWMHLGYKCMLIQLGLEMILTSMCLVMAVRRGIAAA